MPEPFTLRLAVRSDDLDTNGHVRGDAYIIYADHARWRCGDAAGASLDKLQGADRGPVNLETTVKFQHELLAGDEIDVSVTFVWGEGKTWKVEQVITRGDGTVAALVSSTAGMLDLTARRLVDDPAGVWRAACERPELMGL